MKAIWFLLFASSLVFAEDFNQIIPLAKLPAKERLAAIRKKGICVKILESDRKTSEHFFTWKQVEAASGKLSEVTKIKSLVGKTLCQGENPVAAKCPTIVLATDAPGSTLLHEYLHYLQMTKRSSWCSLSKSLWTRRPTEQESRIIRDMEWEVHQYLWDHRSDLDFNLEDKIAIISETIEEAEQRPWDPLAKDYVRKEALVTELGTLIQEYKSKLGIK